jgi:hypothetical protein
MQVVALLLGCINIVYCVCVSVQEPFVLADLTMKAVPQACHCPIHISVRDVVRMHFTALQIIALQVTALSAIWDLWLQPVKQPLAKAT